MIKTKKTVVALLAVCAISATAIAGLSLSKNLRGTAALADTASAVDETTPVAGSENNPVLAEAGVNTISYMVVGGNPEMGYKELVYYMEFTPAESGLYTFTHSNSNIGIADVYSENDYPFGDWNEDWTVYSVELVANQKYTVQVSNFDWMIDLSAYEVGDEYPLAEPATITIAYASAAAGSSHDNAIPYKVGDTIIVPKGHDSVWYTFTESSKATYYLIAMNNSTATVTRGFSTTKVTNGYKTFTNSGTFYIEVSPSATETAEVQILDASKQPEGSCIVKAEALPADGVVGNDTWYTYTVGASNVTASLQPTEDAYVVKNEDGTTTVLSGEVIVYEGYTRIGTLSDGIFTPAVLPVVEEGQPVPTYTDVTLEAGKTYNFYAPAYVYEESEIEDDKVVITLSVDVLSKIVIG